MILNLPTARVFKPLLQPARYLGAHGGRGSGKSHFFAEKLIEHCLMNPGSRSVCIREVQKSLMQSAKKLIEDKLIDNELDKGHGFRITREYIETPGNGLITFTGMQDHTASSVKSMENVSIAWVEEAQTLSEHSLKLLRPTIRAEGSELWFSWNPESKRNPVDSMFRAGKPPTNSICVEANWQDNPWFPKVLEQERKDCLEIDPDQYAHIWQGDYVGILKGAYYAHQISKAIHEGRICKVREDPLHIVRIFTDIGGTGGKSDAFTMWAVQFIGREIRVLNYYEAVGQEFAEHLQWLRDQDYGIKRASIWLPHDGGTKDRVYRVSYESAFKGVGYRVKVIPNQGTGAASMRVAEGRRLFPRMWFDKDKCEGGLEALKWYHEKFDEIRNIGLGPEHDWSSDGADSFGAMCVAYEEPRPHGYKKPRVNSSTRGMMAHG